MKTYIKSIYTILSMLLLLLGNNACNDDFLAYDPFDYTSEEEFVRTPADAQALLNGAYKALASGSFMGGQAWLLAELMADNINGDPNILTNGDWRAHYTRTTDIFLGTTRSLLHDGGKVHGRGNYLLERLNKVEGLSEADRKRITAEVRFLRGISHFELVRMFAQPYGYTADNGHQGIPIHLRYTIDPVDQSTVKAVYDQILSDMQAAATDLPAQNNGYATTWAAKGYLAKVYFQMNDYQNAFNMANDVIQNAGVSFDAGNLKRFSPGGTTEAVFQLISTSLQDNASGALSSYFRLSATNTAQAYMSTDAYAAATLDPADLRAQWFQEVPGGLYAFKKFETSPTQWWNIPLVHLTELKLIRAESAAELGTNLDVAAQDLRDIGIRAGVTPISAGAGATQIILEARKQRRIELMGEGNRFHELKRIATATTGNKTKVPVSNLKIRGADWNCPGMVCQYPDNELSANPNLKPNPFGGCN